MSDPATPRLPDHDALHDAVRRLQANVATVVRGKDEVIQMAVVALLAEGHLLIEDVPGVGKTTLAQALARSLDVEFQRIQFTSDLLPADIIGVSLLDRDTQAFRFSPGPLFANVVLADEINRATPKTQSALLEAMSERRISVDRLQHDLPSPFMVLATQNPVEFEGTFPLPESQLDRFLMSLTIGYPPREDERQLLLRGGVEEELEELEPVLGAHELHLLQRAAGRVRVAEKLVDYVLALAEVTRSRDRFLLGVSPRATQDLLRSAQALAFCEGRDFAVPDDVQRLAVPVLAHRVHTRSAGGLDDARSELRRLLEEIEVPV